LQIFIDGGIRRGGDIFKALALGATAVGLGKPAVYSMSAYGQRGIVRMLQILQEEFIRVMKLMGTPTLADIKPNSVITKDLSYHGNPPMIPPSPYAKSSQDNTTAYLLKRIQDLEAENAALRNQLS